MNTQSEFIFHGFDANNIRRVWGEGPTRDIAETRAHNAALDYVRGRPDTGPLSRWKFTLAASKNGQT